MYALCIWRIDHVLEILIFNLVKYADNEMFCNMNYKLRKV